MQEAQKEREKLHALAVEAVERASIREVDAKVKEKTLKASEKKLKEDKATAEIAIKQNETLKVRPSFFSFSSFQQKKLDEKEKLLKAQEQQIEKDQKIIEVTKADQEAMKKTLEVLKLCFGDLFLASF